MQISLDDNALHINGLSVSLSRHVILSLICRCARGVSQARSHFLGGHTDTPMPGPALESPERGTERT